MTSVLYCNTKQQDLFILTGGMPDGATFTAPYAGPTSRVHPVIPNSNDEERTHDMCGTADADIPSTEVPGGNYLGEKDNPPQHFFCFGLEMPQAIYYLVNNYRYSIKGLLGFVVCKSCVLSCPSL